MSFIRPELTAEAWRLREVLAGAAVAVFGLWTTAQGGWFLIPLGAALLAIGAAWALSAFRRLRFQQDGDAPGLVRVTEAQVAYYGPRLGGFIGLPDLAELRLLTLRGRHIWKLKQADGQLLHIPVEADGADALFDAFASLPGLDMAALVAALGTDAAPSGTNVIALNEVDRLIWTRKGAGIVTV